MIYDAAYSPHPNRYSPISVTSLRNGFNSEFMRPSPIRNMNSSPSNAIVNRQSPSYPSQRLINSRRSPILLVSSFASMSSICKYLNLVAKLSHLSIHNSESEQHQSSSSRTSTRQFRRLVRGWTTIVRSPHHSFPTFFRTYDHLRRQHECKVCLSNLATVCFLPCRHLSACPACAPQLEVRPARVNPA